MNSRVSSRRLSRYWVFALLCIICALVAGGYTRLAALRRSRHGLRLFEPMALNRSQPSSINPPAIAHESGQVPPITPKAAGLGRLSEPNALPSTEDKRTYVMFRSTALDDTYGKVAVAPLDALDKHRYVDQLSCERVAFAGGNGVCLTANWGVFTTYYAVLFDAVFQRRHTITLNGVPSRTRVSEDGKRAAITVFLSGHSYADVGMSTQTIIIDLKSGTVLGDLEQFVIWRDGRRFKERDFNFWGVTFARDGNQFYATLASGRKTYLIEGNVNVREGRVICENVECPSISPDNTRIAFKKRIYSGLRLAWQPYVLDLATMKETALLETRNVDDQVEWLDNQRILYAVPESETISTPGTEVWVLPVDASGPPRKFLRKAYSPIVFFY